jgi:hypothetical protein
MTERAERPARPAARQSIRRKSQIAANARPPAPSCPDLASGMTGAVVYRPSSGPGTCAVTAGCGLLASPTVRQGGGLTLPLVQPGIDRYAAGARSFGQNSGGRDCRLPASTGICFAVSRPPRGHKRHQLRWPDVAAAADDCHPPAREPPGCGGARRRRPAGARQSSGTSGPGRRARKVAMDACNASGG